jgi:hypothetical protein
MTINTVIFGKNVFCGPSVLSAVLGITTDEAVLEINNIRHRPGDKEITSCYLSELVEVMHRKGYSTVYLNHLRDRSLFSLLTLLKDDGVYILNVPGHFICIEINKGKRYICDNHTKDPINANSSARLNQRVVIAVKVWK